MFVNLSSEIMRYSSGVWLGQWAEMRESDGGQSSNAFIADTERIKRFLMHSGFMDATINVIDALSSMISKYIITGKLRIGEEYESLSKNGNKDISRHVMKYYIQKNYDAIRDIIMEKYKCYIGKYYSGNKNFIKRIAQVYITFDCNN